MKKTVLQILNSLLILVSLLIIPLVFQTLNNNSLKRSEITKEAASTSNVLGINTKAENTKVSDDSSILSNFATSKFTLYTLGVLFVISILYFFKYKIQKQKL